LKSRSAADPRCAIPSSGKHGKHWVDVIGIKEIGISDVAEMHPRDVQRGLKEHEKQFTRPVSEALRNLYRQFYRRCADGMPRTNGRNSG
jgi:hypothetical protein